MQYPRQPVAAIQSRSIFDVSSRREDASFLLNRRGFTMPELLVSTLLLTAIFVGVMLTFVKSTQLSDLSRYSAVAVLASKSKLAEIESSAYAQVPAYNNVTFNSNDITGIGVSYVDSSNPDLLQITVVFCWRQRDGRVIGEDRDLDGVLDGGEDLNGNNRLDSVVEFTTLRYNS